MRILYVSHLFPPESYGGTELHVYGLAQSLRLHHDVAVLYRIKRRNEPEYRIIKDNYQGLPVYKIVNNEKDYIYPYQQYYTKGIENAFMDVLEDFHPDIVHFHHLVGLSASLLSITFQKKIPAIFTLHDYWFLCNNALLLTGDQKLCIGPEAGFNCSKCRPPMGGVLEHLKGLGLNAFVHNGIRYVKRRLFSGEFIRGRSPQWYFLRDYYLREQLKKVNLLIAPSQFLKTKYIEWGIPERQIIYSDNGIDHTPFIHYDKIGSSQIRFGFIGTIVYYKGIEVLIEAFNKVQESHAILKIYGGGKNVNALKKLAKNPHIQFLGRFDPENIGRIFSEIDVLVVPSIWYENSPLVIHEAFAANVPVITSDAGGMAELIQHDVTGLLFKIGSVDACYKALKKIIDNPDLIKRFQKNIPKIKTIQENAVEIENIYSKLLSGDL